jgi:hypothetical protein
MYAAHVSTHAPPLLAHVTTPLFREGPPPRPDGFTGLTVSNGIIYAVSMNGYTFAFQASSGRVLWRRETGFANTSAPVVVGDVAYVGSGDVYALNAQDGSVRWRYPTPDVVTSSPVIVNGVLYAGSYGDRVYALNATTGARLWQYDTGGRVYVDPVVADGTVFFGSGDGGSSLYAINAQDGKLVWHNSMLVDSPLDDLKTKKKASPWADLLCDLNAFCSQMVGISSVRCASRCLHSGLLTEILCFLPSDAHAPR